jgi:hypothetical protein
LLAVGVPPQASKNDVARTLILDRGEPEVVDTKPTTAPNFGFVSVEELHATIPAKNDEATRIAQRRPGNENKIGYM